MTKFNTYNDELTKQIDSKAFSMKKKIIVNALLGFLALFLTIGLSGTFYLIKWLNKEFDQNLSAKSSVLVSLAKVDNESVSFDFSGEFMPEFSTTEDPEYFQLWLNSHEVLERSTSLKLLASDADLPVTDFRSTRNVYKDITLPDGRNGRMLSVNFYPQTDTAIAQSDSADSNIPLITLAIAKERVSLDKTIRDFLLIFTVIVILFTIIAAATIWQTVMKGLQPLKNMQRKMSLLAIDNLSERLEFPNPPKELEETIYQFNRMLERLENSFDRQKQFTAEIAHELRTPISQMRSLTEQAIKNGQGTTPYKDILDSTMQMEMTVSNLMALAQCEKGNIILEPQVIKLARKMDACWSKYKAMAAKRSINYVNNITDEFKIISSSDELDIIFNNLISNAINYSVSGSDVTTYCRTENDILCICITNKPQNMSSEEINKIFDRSWQKNNPDSPTRINGLGLALVKSYADLLNLRIKTALSEDGILTIELCGFYQDH